MPKSIWFFLCILVLPWITAAGCSKKRPSIPETQKDFPYKKIAKSNENPADYGPDDETILNAIKGKMKGVAFSHFTHASNAENGYAIPCKACHHKAKNNDDATACIDCHKVASSADDPAHSGPCDNLMLFDKKEKQKPVLFNHYTHASSNGYKIPCTKCHHKNSNQKK
jgi:hypothetical protein